MKAELAYKLHYRKITDLSYLFWLFDYMDFFSSAQVCGGMAIIALISEKHYSIIQSFTILNT
jgi:hypothetical protein